MVTGLLKIHLHLHGIGSLKAKRKIVKSLIGRIQSRFNFSVSEVGAQDSKMVAQIGLGVVSNNSSFVDSQMDTVINFIRADGRFYVGAIHREIFPFNPD